MVTQRWAVTAIALGSIVVVVAIGSVVLGILLGRKKPRHTLVNSNVKVPLRLIDRKNISPDTMRLKFALTSPEDILGIPVGSHVYFSARIDGSMTVRPYTPVTLVDQKGYVDFVIKVYPRGKMTRYLSKLAISHHIDVRGPAGLLRYEGRGVFQVKPDYNSPPAKLTATRVNMICGGSGLTPMFQLLSHILADKEDNTKLALLYANKTERDILLREELDQLRDRHYPQFRVWYTVSTPPDTAWEYGSGHLTERMMAEHLYPPGDDTLVLLCGPPPMLELACYPNLAVLNYPRSRVHTF